MHVLVFRGTQSVEEWLEDIAIAQIDVPLVWFSDGRFQIAKASVGFLLVSAFLYEQVLAAAKAFNSSTLPTPCT